MNKILKRHLSELSSCRQCKSMTGPAIHGCVEKTEIISIGQAPGIHEKKFMKPFSYTAGKTLFKWFASIGVDEEDFRKKVNMAALCRCFPGKAKSGDRKPNREELDRCRNFLDFELQFYKPKLVITIGKMAFEELLSIKHSEPLKHYLGKIHSYAAPNGKSIDLIGLPHPSGVNAWNHSEQGKKLIRKSLLLIQNHATFQKVFRKLV